MSSREVTFTEISPSELKCRYNEGLSINEIATLLHRSYGYVRNRLLQSGATLRDRGAGTRLYIERHPEWIGQFVKYRVKNFGEISNQKILLLSMVITEGYIDRRAIGFTNTQDALHRLFKRLINNVYGSVRVSKSSILSRVMSTEIAKDLKAFMPEKTFTPSVLQRILSSEKLAVKVLKVVADTEGSMIISPKRAARNYTVESRIVLSSKNKKFSEQIAGLLALLQIKSKISKVGVQIARKEDIRRFIHLVGFSRGLRVVRKKAGHALWHNLDKNRLSKVFLRIYGEQERAKRLGLGGCFADCKKKEQVIHRLMSWYQQVNGGDWP